MDFGLQGKSVLVTAASKGIGKATALGFLREGAKVTICARDADGLKLAHEELVAATGGQLLAIQADVTDAKQVAELVEAAESAHGPIQVLVNNAGGPPPGDHKAITESQWTNSFELTVQSAVRLTNLVLPEMEKAGWGRVINISSYSVKQPMDNMMLSNSLRLAVLGWAKTLSSEVAESGVLVNTVCPGWTDTDRVNGLLQHQSLEHGVSEAEVLATITDKVPLNRLAHAEEIANVIIFLASEAASYVTGAAIPVDGGAARVV
ncbi:SDR family oxidoreductase [Halieaceae bacterium IMCC14734]|uniref:SDR family oxidoreductase n=1 Tax=Candidatus Litorirhabdus singularis TaxID=2518993 RepID=A0ABT3TEM1_9GAMM|nr:SDR family oxidoreductase [Candidatus Litorirhabdus singularis]MCX2980758.1 SDR family oxidoreductase [Candidatus Litorirhabdus singularis]